VSDRPIRDRLRQRVPRGWSGVDTDAGWDDIIDRLDQDLAAIEPDYDLHQCKEKFGTLRYYIGSLGDREDVQARIQQAEDESARTCEVCGQPGTLGGTRSWQRTLCVADQAECLSRVSPSGLE
jgi:hypothetical protein